MPFIVFEGLDGSGKSSLMSALDLDLQKKGYKTIRTREPGGTPLGDELREIILRKEGPNPWGRAELLLYEAIRAQHVDEVIKPSLVQQDWILCDRFTASSIAFQAGGREISEEWVEKLNDFATLGTQPNLIVLLDLSVEESRKRRHQRIHQLGGQEDRIESETDSFHQRVRMSFLNQSKKIPEKWLVLDAGESQENLLKLLLQHLKSLQWFNVHPKGSFHPK